MFAVQFKRWPRFTVRARYRAAEKGQTSETSGGLRRWRGVRKGTSHHLVDRRVARSRTRDSLSDKHMGRWWIRKTLREAFSSLFVFAAGLYFQNGVVAGYLDDPGPDPQVAGVVAWLPKAG